MNTIFRHRKQAEIDNLYNVSIVILCPNFVKFSYNQLLEKIVDKF